MGGASRYEVITARSVTSGRASLRLLSLLAVSALVLSIVSSRTFLSWPGADEPAPTIRSDRNGPTAAAVADEKPAAKAGVAATVSRDAAVHSPFAVTVAEPSTEPTTARGTDSVIDRAGWSEGASDGFDGNAAALVEALPISASPPAPRLDGGTADPSPASPGGTGARRPFIDETEDLPSRATISGRVVTTRGDPVPDHPVSVLRRMDGQATRHTVSTDRSGRFVTGRLEPGDYLLRADETAFYLGRTVPARVGTTGLELVVALRDFVTIEGVVTDDFGTPIPEAAVIPPLADERELTNERGEFALNVSTVGRGGLLIRYAAEGYLDETRFFPAERWESGDALDASVRLRRGLFTVRGSVHDEYGYPVNNALVQITSRGMNSHQSTQVDAEGRFALESVLAADDYALRISSTARYRPFAVENLSVDGRLGNLDVTLETVPLGTLSGTLVATSGSPVSHLSLLAFASGEGDRSAAIVSDEEGRFVLEDFVTGDVRLRSRTRPDIEIEGVRIRSGEPQALTFVVDIGEHGLEGVVTNGAGLPVAGARLTMKSVRHEGTIRTTTTHETRSGADGAFRFPGLGPGQRSLMVVADSLGTQRMIVDPAAGNGPIVVALSR